MDIIAALKWTRDNIPAFGGDPTRVTIVGHDTGAALANLVLISKAGKGKFFKNSLFFPVYIDILFNSIAFVPQSMKHVMIHVRKHLGSHEHKQYPMKQHQ